MVNPNFKQSVFFIIGVLAIIAVSRCQMVETTWHRSGDIMSEKRSRYTEEISLEELNDFMKRWPEFNEMNMLDGVDRTNVEDKISKALTWKMRIWFVYRHWDAERFFYVYSRLLTLLEELNVRREAQNIINHLYGRKDSLSQQMIDLQNKRIQKLQMSSKELLMLSARENELREMFKQYP